MLPDIWSETAGVMLALTAFLAWQELPECHRTAIVESYCSERLRFGILVANRTGVSGSLFPSSGRVILPMVDHVNDPGISESGQRFQSVVNTQNL